jgi:hypothetical protein
MSNPLIDVSHIVNWSGSLTGIERVEYNLISYYYNETSSEFVTWSNEARNFIKYPRKQVQSDIINRSADFDNISGSESISKKLLMKIEQKFKFSNKTVSDAVIKEKDFIVLAGLWDNEEYINVLRRLSRSNKIIHVVYDMIPLIHQGYVVDFLPGVFEKYMLKILPLCTGILSISKSTAIDTRKILKDHSLPVPVIRTFRLGDDILDDSKPRKERMFDFDFILCVGTIEARKNHQILYILQKKLISEGKKPTTIVFAGKRGWLTSDLQYMIEHDKSLMGSIVILDKTTDNDLEWLYENCLYTVTPSYYEGWGLPICESLKHSKVTLSSNTSSMPEAGSCYADYFSPYSIDELSILVEKYSIESERRKREKFIKSGYKIYSWADSSRVFSEKVTSIIGG